MTTSYQTIEHEASAQFVEQRSRFIGYAYPVSSEEEVAILLKDLQAKYHDATHICRAYRIGTDDDLIEKSSDDGEPSGTAGRPILGKIKSEDLTNVFVAVVRYFGGVKLGPNGLITAYRLGAELALNEAHKILVEIRQQVTLSFGYEFLGEIMNVSKEYEAKMIAQELMASCRIVFDLPLSKIDPFVKRIQSISYSIEVKLSSMKPCIE